jgi:hypothetical protein
MRAFIRQRAISIGLAMLAVGCRDPSGQPNARATPPGWLNPYDRFRQDSPIPFAPIRGEVAPAQTCGAKRQGPCLLLAWEYYNSARGYSHSAWFMDTDGNEYEFSFNPIASRSARSESADPVRLAIGDRLVTQDDFARIVAASTALPPRVSTADVTHALTLLAASQAGSVEATPFSGCRDGGRSTLDGYVFATEREGSSPLMLEEVKCNLLLKGNASRAARELSQWVHRLRGTVRPYREPK